MRKYWSRATYLWTLAQRLVLTEKALLLVPAPENSNFLTQCWQVFCDEMNEVSQDKRTIVINSNDDKKDSLQNIKGNLVNQRAVNYFNQITRKKFTTQSGVMVSSIAQDFFAAQNKVPKTSHEETWVNNNLGP